MGGGGGGEAARRLRRARPAPTVRCGGCDEVSRPVVRAPGGVEGCAAGSPHALRAGKGGGDGDLEGGAVARLPTRSADGGTHGLVARRGLRGAEARRPVHGADADRIGCGRGAACCWRAGGRRRRGRWSRSQAPGAECRWRESRARCSAGGRLPQGAGGEGAAGAGEFGPEEGGAEARLPALGADGEGHWRGSTCRRGAGGGRGAPGWGGP